MSDLHTCTGACLYASFDAVPNCLNRQMFCNTQGIHSNAAFPLYAHVNERAALTAANNKLSESRLDTRTPYLNKRFAATFVITHKWPLSRVYPHMSSQVTASCKRFLTLFLFADMRMRSLFSYSILLAIFRRCRWWRWWWRWWWCLRR